MSPFSLLQTWFAEETLAATAPVPGACCLSTVGLDGYPNARFVALKEVSEAGLVITGPMNARKGQEAAAIPKAALTCWWTATARQIRVQGDLVWLGEEEADRHFAARKREAQLVPHASKQGQPMGDPAGLQERYAALEASLAGKPVPRPSSWGGLLIRPVRIEFLEFSDTRFHKRRLFEREEAGWTCTFLQP